MKGEWTKILTEQDHTQFTEEFMCIHPHEPWWTFKPVYRAYPLYLESNLRRCQLEFLSPSTFQAAKPLGHSSPLGSSEPWSWSGMNLCSWCRDGALTWLICRLSGESQLSLRAALLPAALVYKQMKENMNRTAEATLYMQRKSAAKPLRVIDPYIYLLPCTNCIFRWYKAVVRLWCSPSCCLYCSKKWNTSMIKSQEVLWQI